MRPRMGFYDRYSVIENLVFGILLLGKWKHVCSFSDPLALAYLIYMG